MTKRKLTLTSLLIFVALYVPLWMSAKTFPVVAQAHLSVTLWGWALIIAGVFALIFVRAFVLVYCDWSFKNMAVKLGMSDEIAMFVDEIGNILAYVSAFLVLAYLVPGAVSYSSLPAVLLWTLIFGFSSGTARLIDNRLFADKN